MPAAVPAGVTIVRWARHGLPRFGVPICRDALRNLRPVRKLRHPRRARIPPHGRHGSRSRAYCPVQAGLFVPPRAVIFW
jgi:hypothetical protein